MKIVKRLRILIYTFALNLSVSTCLYSGAPSDLIIITDIDDTIELSRVGPNKNIASLAMNLFNLHDAFVGMPAIYQQLAGQGAKFFYVSNKPQIIGFTARRFLENSEFPPGPLLLRKKISIPGKANKIDRITKILDAYPERRILLVGDDGEEDIAIYDYFQKNPKYKNQIEAVYIHDLYRPVHLEIGENQTPFYTAADFALRLFLKQLINEHQLAVTVNIVKRGFASPSRSIREKTFPSFAEIQPGPIDSLIQVAQTLPQNLKSTTLEILHEIRTKGCRRALASLEKI